MCCAAKNETSVVTMKLTKYDRQCIMRLLSEGESLEDICEYFEYPIELILEVKEGMDE